MEFQINNLKIMKYLKSSCIYILVLLFIALFSCKNDINNNNFKGNWWFVKPDSSYNELYIRDSTFVIMSDVINGPGYTYTYFYKNDSLQVIENTMVVNKYPFVYSNKPEFLFIKIERDWVYLHRIQENIKSYLDLKNDESNEKEYDEAIIGFMKRKIKFHCY